MRLQGLIRGSSLLIAFAISGIGHSQIAIDNNVSADNLAKSIMAPANIVVPGSVVLNCPTGAYGAFTNGTSDGLGIENGIILTTGQTSIFEQDNTSGSEGTNNNISGFVDADLQAIEPLATYDGCVIEFDIEPICDRLVLDYIWGSDEYPEYVNGGYNDAFGFFVSGPGIIGTQNIATVPGTTTLVSIDNVNGGSNSAYYVDNTGGNLVEYDGYTKDLSAEVNVTPCETYHLKIVCADAGDGIYDSGVLIAVNNPPCPINYVNWVGVDTVAAEGCQDLNVTLERTGETSEPLDVTFEVLGTATDGIDYIFGETDHRFNPNNTSESYNITVNPDAIAEGQESVTLIAKITNCSEEYTDTITLIIEESNVQIDTTSTPETCIGMCDGAVSAQGVGASPFTYLWEGGETTTGLNNLCAGNYIVTVTDANGCVGTDTITVSSGANIGDATITSPQDTFCLNETGVLLTAVTTGGTWFGNGMDASGIFNPSTAGVGTHTIEYQITGACGDTGTYEIVVNPLKDATINTGFPTQVCIDDTNVIFTSINAGGTWSGNGINPATGVFSPAGAGEGTHEIVYTLSNPCGDTDTVIISVLPRKDPTISATQTIFCKNESGITLTTVDPGGTWSGNGVHATTGEFDPATASSGMHELIYTITDFCGAADTITMTVNPVQNSNIHGPDTNTVCILDLTFDLTVDVDSGTWDNPNITQVGNTATVDVTALGVGFHELRYTLGDPCGDEDTVWIEITSQVLATITPVGPFCEDDTLISVVGTNAGGTWIGNGINGTTGEFNPSTAGEGIHQIIYTTPGNCGHVDTTNIEVVGYNDPTITITDVLVCDDFGDINLTSNEAGGKWELITGTSGLDTSAMTFNTITSQAGNFELKYSFGGLCPMADTIGIEIQAYLDPFVDSIPPLCDSWSPVVLNATTTGGSFTGPGLSGNPIEFNPTGAGTGIHNFTYTVGGLCVSTYDFTIEVLPQQSANIEPVPELCVSENAYQLNTTSTGGIWTGQGITDANLGTFNATSLGAGSHIVNYEIGGQCGDTASLTIDVVNPIDATIFPPDPICEGFDSLQIETVNPGGTWSGGAVDSDGFVNNNLQNGKYNIVYSFNSTCSSSDSVELEILDVPNSEFVIAPRSGCIPLTVGFFDVSDSIAVNTYWDFGNGETATSLDTASMTYYDAGCYDITLYNEYANGCSDSTTEVDAVCAYPIPDADFAFLPEDPDITNQIIELYNLSTTEATYWWDFGPEAADRFSSDQNPLAIYSLFEEDTVSISLNVMNVHGCLDSILKKVLIEDIPTLYVPNAFTPNGDGKNDYFLPLTNAYKLTDYKLVIYDRWGNLIFESTDPYEPWDGTVQRATSSNDIAQIDVYVWKVYFRSEKDGFVPSEQVGTVSLIK